MYLLPKLQVGDEIWRALPGLCWLLCPVETLGKPIVVSYGMPRKERLVYVELDQALNVTVSGWILTSMAGQLVCQLSRNK